MVREAVAMMLGVDDYDVFTASNRVEALRLLEQGSYDVIVSDLRISNLDGPMFYHELEQHRPDALKRLIFMTGHAKASEYAGFLEETRVPVLAKPFSPEQLRLAVQRVLATP